MRSRIVSMALVCLVSVLVVGCGAKRGTARSGEEGTESAPPTAKESESERQPVVETPRAPTSPKPAYSMSHLVGTWDFAPSPAQSEFAAAMNKTAGPLTYTFERGGAYKAVGGPLSGKDYAEEGTYEFDGRTLSLHRKGVGGTRAPVYERTNRNVVRFEDDGSTLVGDTKFGNWLFMGEAVRFRKR